MEFKKLLLEEVRTRLYARLKDTASAIVKEIIQKEIAHRVRKRVSCQVVLMNRPFINNPFYSFTSRSRSLCEMRCSCTSIKSWKCRSACITRKSIVSSIVLASSLLIGR